MRGCEELKNRFWQKQRDNIRRLCLREMESIEHMAKDCIRKIRSNNSTSSSLNDMGIKWIQKIFSEKEKRREFILLFLN